MIPGLGRSPGEGKGYPLQYSGLENSMDYAVHGIAKTWTQLSDFHFTSLYTFPANVTPEPFCSLTHKHTANALGAYLLLIRMPAVLFSYI